MPPSELTPVDTNHTTQYSRLFTLQQVVWKSLSSTNDQHSNGPFYSGPIVSDILSAKIHSDLMTDVTAALDAMGFRRFRLLGSGHFSLAMETTDNQIIRLTYYRAEHLKENRPEHPAILQPITVTSISGRDNPREGIIIEILPKVKTAGVTEHHLDMLEAALTTSGISVHDIRKKANVGLMEIDGKEIPVLIDPSVAVTTAPLTESQQHLEPWLAPDGTWLQKIYEPRTAPTNVIPKTVADTVEAVTRGPRPLLDRALGKIGVRRDSRRMSQTASAIKEDGMYGDQLATLYQRTTDRVNGASNQIPFSQLLEEERRKMNEEQERPQPFPPAR
jgi:hypothetical protein